MNQHELFAQKLLSALTPLLIAINYSDFLKGIGAFLSVLGTLIVIVYYLAMLKMNVVDVKFNGSWKQFIKSFIKI